MEQPTNTSITDEADKTRKVSNVDFFAVMITAFLPLFQEAAFAEAQAKVVPYDVGASVH